MDAVKEAKRAGFHAFLLGAFWSIGLLFLYLINTVLFRHNRFIFLPVFGLLALYLLIAGFIQWLTGKGGIKSRETGLSPRDTVLVQAALFIIIGLIQHFVTI